VAATFSRQGQAGNNSAAIIRKPCMGSLLRMPVCPLFSFSIPLQVVSESGSMALHRDIYWVGRQWAVTGFGIQAVDQRLQGAFDIEASQVWDEGLQARMRSHPWVNGADFEKALLTARRRFPEPARKSLPLGDSVPELIQQPVPAPAPRPITSSRNDQAGPQLAEAPTPVERPRPAAQPPFQLRVQGQLARFVLQWRVRR
jgi:hypothetical protein